jgi:hypothetical protein
MPIHSNPVVFPVADLRMGYAKVQVIAAPVLPDSSVNLKFR